MAGERYLLFDLHRSDGVEATFGLDVADVSQVVEPEFVSPVPLAPVIVEGIMNYGGRIITIVDPAEVLGLGHQHGPTRSVVIVRGGTRTNLGLKVARIRQIVSKSSMQEAKVAVEPPVKTSFRLGNRLVHIVDVVAFLERLGEKFGPAPGFGPAEGVSS